MKAGLRYSGTNYDTAKHSCKGKNDCKGQGGCKSSDNGCKGKNSCKGKGGCATDGSKMPDARLASFPRASGAAGNRSSDLPLAPLRVSTPEP